MHGPIQLGFPAFSYTPTEAKRSVFQKLHHLGIIFVEAQGVVLKRGLPGGELIVEVLYLLIICNLGSEKSNGVKC